MNDNKIRAKEKKNNFRRLSLNYIYHLLLLHISFPLRLS